MEWELNLADRAALRPNLLPRLRMAIIKYLLYVQGGGGDPSQDRVTWCTNNMPNIPNLAEQISYYCISEPTFIAGGTSITDGALQSRVEFVLRTYFMPA